VSYNHAIGFIDKIVSAYYTSVIKILITLTILYLSTAGPAVLK